MCFLAGGGRGVALLLDLVIAPDKVTTDMADSSLLVLSFAAEIRSGLWLRNGQCMNDQVSGGTPPLA